MSAFANLPNLSLTEWAVLEMTNDPVMHVSRIARRRRSPQILTTKEAYIWAVLMAEAAESESVSPQEMSGLITAGRDFEPERLLQALHTRFANLTQQELRDRANSAYHSLLERGLIEDPPVVFIGGIAVSVLGWIPVSFTKKTSEGKVVSRKINALFWKYERSTRKGVTTTSVQFRLMRLVNALKAGISAAQRELTAGDSREN